MSISSNPSDLFDTPTPQPIKIPGSLTLTFGALAEDDERMAVEYAILDPSPVKFVVNGLLVSTVSVCDGAGAESTVIPGGGDNVRVHFIRHVVFTTPLAYDNGSPTPPLPAIHIRLTAKQGAKTCIQAPLAVAIAI
jgi:hypothetical protein